MRIFIGFREVTVAHRFVSALVAFSIAAYAAFPSAAALAGSSNPNPRANRLCPFGPGKARWDVKTSIASDQDPHRLATVAIKNLISAPNLHVDPRTIATAKVHVGRARAMMRAAQGMPLTAAPLPPFVAHLRWGGSREAASPQNLAPGQPPMAAGAPPSPDFLLDLPPVTPAVVQRADAIAQSTNPEEAPPSFFDTLLSSQLHSIRLPQPIALGNEQFHEGDLVSVSGFVLKSTCEHDDGDFHIDLGSSANAATCLIVEVPNPAYIASPPLRAAVAKAEIAAKSLSPGTRVTVSGQLFYDATHMSSTDPGGGRGVGHCARSLWEVHPVFSIVRG
jgi:hypothetical protein